MNLSSSSDAGQHKMPMFSVSMTCEVWTACQLTISTRQQPIKTIHRKEPFLITCKTLSFTMPPSTNWLVRDAIFDVQGNGSNTQPFHLASNPKNVCPNSGIERHESQGTTALCKVRICQSIRHHKGTVGRQALAMYRESAFVDISCLAS